MDDSTNPYQSPLATNHVRRTPSWHRWRTATSVLLMVIGTMFLLLLNGQEFTNSIVFLVCWITSLGIWLTNAAQKPRKIEVVLLIGLHVVMIRRFAVTWAELAASEWRWVTQKTRDDQHGWAMVKNMVNLPLRILAIIWASPYTLLGLLLGMAGVCTGGHARIRGRVIEFYGGGVKWLLHRFPDGQFTLAFTLGHTVLGQTDAALDVCRDHELVHVRQFERWGPFMGPAYLGCSLVLWLMRRRPYRDNPFERQAYERGGGD